MRHLLLASGALCSLSTFACGGRVERTSPDPEDEGQVQGLYEDYCGTQPKDYNCVRPPFTLGDSMERALAHPDLPSDAFLIGVDGDGVLPDGKMFDKGFWRLNFASEITGSTYDAYVRINSVEITLNVTAYDCILEDAIAWKDIPQMIGKATQQALADLEWDIQPNEFSLFFDRYSDCLWTDWSLSYFSLQKHPPDDPGYLNWVYIEYTQEGELAQICRIEEDNCANIFGQYD